MGIKAQNTKNVSVFPHIQIHNKPNLIVSVGYFCCSPFFWTGMLVCVADLHVEAGRLSFYGSFGLRLLLQLLHQAVPVLLHLTQPSRQIQLLTGFFRQELLEEGKVGRYISK